MAVRCPALAAFLTLTGLLGLGSPACGGGDDDDAAADAAQGEVVDGSPAETCDRRGFDPAVQGARRYAIQGTDGIVIFDGYTADAPPRDELSIGHYFDADSPDRPRTIELDGENFATCGDCVVAHAECTDAGCAKAFLARSGTLQVTSLGAAGERYTATATDVRLIEVTLDLDTAESAPVQGGETWCIDDLTVDAVVTAAGGG